MNTTWQTAAALQKATLAARAASGVMVCTRIRAGRVEVGYWLNDMPKADDWVSLSADGSSEEAITVLGDIERDHKEKRVCPKEN